ncbi:MAG: alpha/beta fold hydrolase [Bacilli bacterium]|nr:alpha/beta fold hydrolase [Bacilli bacterium]
MKKAVLVIHGFAGGCYDEENVATYLELKGYHVFQFTLPGHDKRMFQHVKKEDWIKSCEEHIEQLINNGYKRIYLIGHSMGGVLACHLASKYKEVKKMVLAAPAFKYMTFGGDEFKLFHALRNTPKLFKDYGKDVLLPRAIMFPVSVVKEFMALADESQDLPSKVTCPILLFHGTKDDVVPIESSKYVYNMALNNEKELVVLENVTHDIFKSDQIDYINKKIFEFFGTFIW